MRVLVTHNGRNYQNEPTTTRNMFSRRVTDVTNPRSGSFGFASDFLNKLRDVFRAITQGGKANQGHSRLLPTLN